jgi:hypothetical protein
MQLPYDMIVNLRMDGIQNVKATCQMSRNFSHLDRHSVVMGICHESV